MAFGGDVAEMNAAHGSLTRRRRRLGRSATSASVLAIGLLAASGAVATAEPPRPATAADGATQWNHIATGWFYSCGIQLRNTLWCWGQNHGGQLGIGTKQYPNQPQQVTRPAVAGWATITAGYDHTCATRKDGTLWCWGDNGSGQLGIRTFVSHTLPRQIGIPETSGWAGVSAGIDDTCAVRTDTSLWCWGYNGYGTVGIGTTTLPKDKPHRVTTPAATGWVSVAVGGQQACATRTDGTLWCWGYNGNGELGIGTTSSHEDKPQQVITPDTTGWVSVAAGADHTCATRADTSLWCWGSNGSGQLGDGTKTMQDLPQQVTTPTVAGWTSVTAGGAQTCAIRTHALWCWGRNYDGQLGIGTNMGHWRPRRVLVPAKRGWGLIAASGYHTCATRTGHTLWCWGYNGYGELGLGNNTWHNLPQQVTA